MQQLVRFDKETTKAFDKFKAKSGIKTNNKVLAHMVNTHQIYIDDLNETRARLYEAERELRETKAAINEYLQAFEHLKEMG